MSKNKIQFLGILTLVALASGCGSSDNAIPPATVTGAQQPGYDPNNPNYYNNGNSFGYLGGYVRNPYRTPILNPNDPAGPLAWQTSRYFRKGQRITVTGGSGGWGTLHESTRKVFFNIFRVYSWRLRCDEVDVNGRDRDGKTVTYRGGPAGLYASDGVQTYLVGSSGVTFTANADGYLLLGYNMANEVNTCYNLNVNATIN